MKNRTPAGTGRVLITMPVLLALVVSGCSLAEPPVGSDTPVGSESSEQPSADVAVVGDEPWRVEGTLTAPEVAWSWSYWSPGVANEDASFQAVTVGEPALLVVVSTGESTSTAAGEDLTAQALDPGTGALVWSVNLTATMGFTSWVDVDMLAATPDGRDVIIAMSSDAPEQATWAIRLDGTDGRLADRVRLTGTWPDVAVAGSVLVTESDGQVYGFDTATLSAGPIWQVPYDNPTADEELPENRSSAELETLTSSLVALSVYGHDERVLLDATTGNHVPTDVAARLDEGWLLPTQNPSVWLLSSESTLQAVTATGTPLWSAPAACTSLPLDGFGPWLPTAGVPGDVVPCIAGDTVDLLRLSSGEPSASFAVDVSGDPLTFMVDERVFLLSEAGMQVFDPAGTILLSAPVWVPPVAATDGAGGTLGLTLGADGQTAYFGNREEVRAVDLTSGTVLWALPHDGLTLISGGHLILIDRSSGLLVGLAGL